MKPSVYSIFLIFCLVAPVTLLTGLLHYQKKQIRKEVKREMMRMIDRSELVFLRFSFAEVKVMLKWKHAGEFEYQGEMYDIVEKKEQGDSLLLWCWWDKAETKLNRKLHELAARALGTDIPTREKQNSLQHFLQSLICPGLPEWSKSVLLAGRISPEPAIHYRKLSWPPPVPPPESGQATKI